MSIKFYGEPPPAQFQKLRPGGICPYCKEAGEWKPQTSPNWTSIGADRVLSFIVSYSCSLCLKPIPIQWTVQSAAGTQAIGSPKLVLRAVEKFDFDHVPEAVEKEIREALDCLSVGALSGFAAVCRRAVQAVCTDLGAKGSTRVKKQIEEAAELAGLPDETKDLAYQVMLTGHDGSHPHLIELNSARAEVLRFLLQDLTSQIYTRPGKVRQAAALRQEAARGVTG